MRWRKHTYIHTNKYKYKYKRWVESLGQVGESSGALGNALIFVVSGAYLLSGMYVCMYVCVQTDDEIIRVYYLTEDR